MEHKCGQCALKALKGGMCPVFNADMSNEDGCPCFTTELHTCEVCGNLILRSGALEQDDEGSWHSMCSNCLGSPPCQTCVRTKECAFQTDQTCPEPPVIMVQQRQGNMIMQTQKINPKRVEATCRKGCPCFFEDGLDDGNFCLKQIGCGCKSYKTNWRNK